MEIDSSGPNIDVSFKPTTGSPYKIYRISDSDSPLTLYGNSRFNKGLYVAGTQMVGADGYWAGPDTNIKGEKGMTPLQKHPLPLHTAKQICPSLHLKQCLWKLFQKCHQD